MPRDFSRGSRVAGLIQREIANLIQQEVKDPRLGMITINAVKISRDLAFADVYFSVFPSERSAESEGVLEHASGFLRSRLAKKIDIRKTPSLRFHYDETIDNGARLTRAINDAVASDNAHPCDAGR